MTPQKITVKIPRKQGELIPFDLEKWNTGEYEAVDKDKRVGRVLCTDNGGSYPIIVAYGNGRLPTYTIDGKINTIHTSPSLFLRKKSECELPKDEYMNIYPSGNSKAYPTLEKVNHYATTNRIAIIHITYDWED